MRGSKERVKPQTKLLLRYVDREMSVEEAEVFRKTLAASPELCRELLEMQRVGDLVRTFAAAAEARGVGLLEPTLLRVKQAERKRSRQATLGYALAAGLLLVLPWSRHAPELGLPHQQSELSSPAGAAIERLDAADTRAQVFVVGSSSTPVVWLADDAPDDDASEQQGPG
jgi:anti-sigma factor RsiW